MDVDPDEMAKMMGFSAFGTQPKDDTSDKKRKREVSSNFVPLGIARSVRDTRSERTPVQAIEQQQASTSTEPDLRAYRNGVRNEKGDMVYFMPSFIDDPWKHLRSK